MEIKLANTTTKMMVCWENDTKIPS